MYLENQEALDFARHRETAEEIELYHYVQQLAREPFDDAKKSFYRLLFDANTYPDQGTRRALEKIISGAEFSRTGKYVINRCFYTIGNPWLQKNTHHDALKELISCADRKPPSLAMDKYARVWRKQLDDYFASDLYRALKRQMYLLQDSPDSTLKQDNEKFGAALKRYHFIHEVVTVTEDIPKRLRDSIYQARLRGVMTLNQQLREFAKSWESSHTASNPTWIPDMELGSAIWNYRPDRENSLLLQAKDFFQDYQRCRTLKQMRQAFSAYIREPLVEADSRYQKGGFIYRLEQVLQQGGADDMAINLVSVTTICQRILQFLIVKDFYRNVPVELDKMIDRVGHQVTTTVLLRIVLFWRRICPWLESRFGILFHSFENHLKSEIDWVVQAFEHMNVALALNHYQIGHVQLANRVQVA
jgi:hypothetical protein